jgi:hypothetical protein
VTLVPNKPGHANSSKLKDPVPKRITHRRQTTKSKMQVALRSFQSVMTKMMKKVVLDRIILSHQVMNPIMPKTRNLIAGHRIRGNLGVKRKTETK